jgi:c-di-GMP-binding flagellar brake protein YcgR
MGNNIAEGKFSKESIPTGPTPLTINDLLQVKVPSDANSGSYYSRVSNISDGKIVIAWPTDRGIRLLVHIDQMLELSFVREGIPYAFSGLVDETAIEPLPQISIILTSAISQTQRRQNFRAKCLVPVEILGSTQDHNSSGTEITKVIDIKTVTYDLSAGGLAIRQPAQIPEGSIVEIKLALPDEGPVIRIPSRVAHSENLHGRQSLYHVGLHYLAISQRECARIVRYLYRIQLKNHVGN